MSGKKKWIFLVGLALASFAGSFFISYKTAKPRAEEAGKGPTTAPSGETALGEPLGPKEKLLDDLARELRQKIQDFQRKEMRLGDQEKRIKIALEQLEKQAKELDNLRMQLVAPLARLKEAQAELDRNRVQVSLDEKTNLKRTAAIYEKMDATAGGKILESMCQNKQEDDAAKILVYMAERSAAKLLAEITDKTVVAKLCDRMKRIKEEG
jgi:flagellar motility protein MotE (MotC chaperone)